MIDYSFIKNKIKQMKIFTELFDFFLPRICVSCQNKLNSNEQYICSSCFRSIKKTPKYLIENEFQRKFAEEKIISDFLPLFIFEKEKALQQLIHELKYNGNFKIGIYLGESIGKEFGKKIKAWEPDLIIPVPLYHLKKAERGYNQSYYIAKGISNICKVEVSTSLLKRSRYTISQTELNFEERKENVKGAFELIISQRLMRLWFRRNYIESKRIILVDDVITTGATISECGKVLLSNGASKIYALSAAIAC